MRRCTYRGLAPAREDPAAALWPAQRQHRRCAWTHAQRALAHAQPGPPVDGDGCGGCSTGFSSLNEQLQWQQRKQATLAARRQQWLQDLEQQEQQQQQQQEQQQQQRQEQQQQQDEHHQHAERLREVLQLGPFRFATLAAAEPGILGFQPDTLDLTLEALAEALTLPRRAVVDVAQRRPGMLVQPQDPVAVLHTLARVLERTPQQTAFLLTPHPALLALAPRQLEERLRQLAAAMHWGSTDAELRCAAVAVGGATFLQLLSAPVRRTHEGLAALAAALDTTPATCARLAGRRPALLQMSPAVVRSRLFAIADAGGDSCRNLLAVIDEQQLAGLATWLLLTPARLQQALDGVGALLGGRRPPGVVVRVMLRLGGFSALHGAHAKMTALRSLARGHDPWERELAGGGDDGLAALLTAPHTALARVRYLVDTGRREGCGLSLLEVVELPAAEFGSHFGPGGEYAAWLHGSLGP